jgi:hypothetical protein
MTKALQIAAFDGWDNSKGRKEWEWCKDGEYCSDHLLECFYNNPNKLMILFCEINEACNHYKIFILPNRIELIYDGEYVSGGIYKGIDGLINLLQTEIIKYFELLEKDK